MNGLDQIRLASHDLFCLSDVPQIADCFRYVSFNLLTTLPATVFNGLERLEWL